MDLLSELNVLIGGRVGRCDLVAKMTKPTTIPNALIRINGLVFLESISLGFILPLLSILPTNYFAQQLHDGVAIDCAKFACTKLCQEASQTANAYGSRISSIGSLIGFLTAPFIGALSDQFGRKPFFVIRQSMDFFFPLTIIWFYKNIASIRYYYISYFLLKAIGTSSVSNASVADCTCPEDRAVSFSILMAVMAVGVFIGSSSVSVFLIDQILLLSVVIHALRVFYAICSIPETLPQHLRHNRLEDVNPFKSLGLLRRSRLFRYLAMLIVVLNTVTSGVDSILPYFLNSIFQFSVDDLSHQTSVYVISMFVVQAILAKPLLNRFGERGVLIFSTMATVSKYLIYAMAVKMHQRWLIYAASVAGGIDSISFAAIASLKSINSDQKEQGKIQGAVYGLRALSESAGPLLYSYLYRLVESRTEMEFKIIPFIGSAIIVFASIVLILAIPSSSTILPMADAQNPLLADEEPDDDDEENV